MEPQTQSQPAPQPQQPTQPQPVIPPITTHNYGKHGHKKFWLLTIVILLLAAGGVYALYSSQQKKVDTLNSQVSNLSTKNTDLNKQLATAKLQIPPAKTDYSPQCNAKTNDALLSAPVNTTPVKGYQLFVVSCLGDSTIPAKIVAFKVSDDGTRKFAYGASTLEPMCISKTIIPDAEVISQATKVAVCKSS